jgi:hypothetical protein
MSMNNPAVAVASFLGQVEGSIHVLGKLGTHGCELEDSGRSLFTDNLNCPAIKKTYLVRHLLLVQE